MSEQTRAANWARKVPKLRRMAQELAEAGYEVREPPNMETPPHKRGLPLAHEPRYSTGSGRVPAGTDGGPALTISNRTED